MGHVVYHYFLFVLRFSIFSYFFLHSLQMHKVHGHSAVISINFGQFKVGPREIGPNQQIQQIILAPF